MSLKYYDSGSAIHQLLLLFIIAISVNFSLRLSAEQAGNVMILL